MAAGRVDPISAINPTKTDWIIKVRVVRIWLMPASPSTSSYHGIKMVLCDSEIL
ncbi:replication protein A 70 kDa DNA-binding subunit A-like [Senna tora]|uniref:Replication protein A 70 kDa DNA-binding subunit A-like n=1 Tax=Senna tora TaxID=362788 RepID=A0A834WP42_9FABA|nr:replication protein A 70 kDa DNA-binding subunit A-like [Senna tora]